MTGCYIHGIQRIAPSAHHPKPSDGQHAAACLMAHTSRQSRRPSQSPGIAWEVVAMLDFGPWHRVSLKGNSQANEKLFVATSRREAIERTMNETLKVIKRRRSIRAYRPQQIADQELEAILEAAIWAPSAMNQQKWHFTVIQTRTCCRRLLTWPGRS